MKILLTLCLLTLLCFLGSSSAGPQGPQLVGEGFCCSNYNDVIIPKDKVKHLQMSPYHCSLRSVIVITTKDKRFCLDPSRSWTQRLQKQFGKPLHRTVNVGQNQAAWTSCPGCGSEAPGPVPSSLLPTISSSFPVSPVSEGNFSGSRSTSESRFKSF